MASISKRTIKSGEARYDVRLRVDGGVLTRTFRRRADAERWARQQEGRKDLGDFVDVRAGAVLLAEYAERWLPARDLRPRTSELYRHLLDQRLAPSFGPMPINRITTDGVRAWHRAVTRDVSGLQAAKAYRLLRAMLNTAVADGLLARNPCCIPGAGQERSPERPLVEPADVVRLADAIDPRFRALVLLAAIGGLRVGELLGLQRRHLDLTEATVRVEQQAIELADGTRIVTSPKTDAGRRTVAVPVVVGQALEEHLARFTGESPEAWVFVGERGGPLRRVTLQQAWTEARGATGLTHITLHDLRHAGATLAAWVGASTRELMARLGHNTPPEPPCAISTQRIIATARSPTGSASCSTDSSHDGGVPRPDQGNLMEPDPVILDSARRHGVADHDMLHAYRNPIRVFDLDDLTMLVGPAVTGRLLEVGVAAAEGLDFIVHAMPARPRYVR